MSTLLPMAVTRQTPPAHARAHAAPRRAGWLTGGGTTGNEQLTAATGAVLIGLLAVIGVTLLRLRPLLSVHLFVGMLLIPPVALKLATTGYRFARYYTRNPAYRLKGPPSALLRALAPMVVLTTVVVFASGVALLFAGPSSRSTMLPIHKVSFVAWVVFTGLHVLGHLPGMPSALSADYGRGAQLGEDVPGRSGRVLALAGALVLGVALAILVIGEYGPWLHYTTLFHGDH